MLLVCGAESTLMPVGLIDPARRPVWVPAGYGHHITPVENVNYNTS